MNTSRMHAAKIDPSSFLPRVIASQHFAQQLFSLPHLLRGAVRPDRFRRHYCHAAENKWEHEEAHQEESEEARFPPGEHPLEGVPNVEGLAAPEALSARIDLSEVS